MRDTQPIKKYKSVNLKPEAFEKLQTLVKLLSNDIATVNIGKLVAQLIDEKYNEFTA